jgi:hypothetical protein
VEKLETGQLAFSDKLVMPGAIYVRRLDNKEPAYLFHKFTASPNYIESFVLSIFRFLRVVCWSSLIA